MKQMKKSDWVARQCFKIILVLCSVIFLLNVFWPDQGKSDVENRPLAQFPTLSQHFLNDLDSYFSDQFIGRNFLLNANYVLKKTEGIKEIDGVYLGKGRLIQQSEPYDEQIVSKNMDALNAFYQKYPLNTTLMIVPTAQSIEKDQLPAFVVTQEEQLDSIYAKIGEGIANVDLRPILNEHKNEDIYYKTDHHWTSLGAKYGYEGMFQSEPQCTVYPLTSDFQGTLASKTGSPFLKDSIDLYVPNNMPDYVVTYGSDQHKSRTMYDQDAIHTKDKYQVFLGPNQGMVKIESNNESDKRLVIFKDSYANSLIQFLIPQYRTITIIDPRYYYDDIDKVMKSDLITDVLVCYNYSNFVSDSTLSDVLQSAG